MEYERGEHILQEKFGTMKKAASFYDNQVLNHINLLMKTFILKRNMVFIATSDRTGNCDSSFRAGEEGFIQVISNQLLIYPEYSGNGVMASMGNIAENPHIGLLFIDFTENQIGLHVNGKASILESRELASLPISKEEVNELEKREGDKPVCWIVIEVEEAYIHCSKHIPALKGADGEEERHSDEDKKKGGDFFKTKTVK